MVTRIYLPSTGAPPVSPAFDAAWDVNTGADRIRAVANLKSGTAMASKATAETSATAVNVLSRQYLAGPLAAGAINGTVKGQIRCQEANADADYRVQLSIRLVSADGTTFRGTLRAADSEALSSEFTTTLTNRSIPLASLVPQGLTEQTAQAGDWLVIEIGYRSHNTHTTSRTGTFRYGDSATSDLAEDETTTADNNPWIEFSQSIPIQEIDTRQVVTEVGHVYNGPVQVRQVVTEVGYLRRSAGQEVRVRQVIAEVAWAWATGFEGQSDGAAGVSGDLTEYTPPEAIEPEPEYPPIVEYMLKLRGANGVLLAVLTGHAEGGFLDVTYRKVVNAPGLLTFALATDSAAAGMLEHRGIVEFWRRDTGNAIPWTRDFTGLILRRRYEYKDSDRVRVYCPGINWLLATRHVLWPAGTTNRSEFRNDPAETIAKTLVAYNAGDDATVANGRVREGAIAGLNVEANAAGGNALDWYCAWDNLLESLQGLAAVGGGDFELGQVGDAAAWEFRWHAGQLGADRTATVRFALEWGNMAAPQYEDDRMDEKDVVAVLGQGEGTERTVVIRTAGDAAVETTADARNEATMAALSAVGDRRLAEGARRQTFEFDAMQTPACLYGKHYFVGDLVTARYGGIVELTRKVVAVTVSMGEDGTMAITPEFGAP
jgi:hypothetical protein